MTRAQQPTLFAIAPTRQRKHSCHATGCAASVPPEMLMCKDHWQMVPRTIQIAVRENYRRGQCDDITPSQGYCRAARLAVIAVARLEGRLPDTRLYDFFLREEPINENSNETRRAKSAASC